MANSRLLVALLLVITGFNIALYNTGFGIGVGVFQAFVTFAILAVLPTKKQTPLAWGTAFIAIVTGLLVGFRANSFVQGISLAVSMGSVGFLLLLVSLPEAPSTIWQLVSSQASYALFSLFGPFRLLQSMSDRPRTVTEKHAWLNPFQLLKTAVFTIIVFAVFAGLLMAADPIFKQMIETILRQAMGRIGWSLFLAAVFASLLTIVLPKQEKKSPELRFFSPQDVVVPVVVLVGLFGLFLFVQGKYLFASHEIFKQFGITYSEYVRKGFSELLVATGIASILSYILILKQRVVGKSYLTWLNVALLVELGLLLASAWRRDMMYIEVYGLTRMRIIGEVFLFWLVGNLILLLLLATWKQFEERYVMVGMGMLTVVAISYFNIVNMDMRIVHVSPKREDVKDLFYLANLSEDAAPAWEGLVTSGEQLFGKLKDKHALTDTEKSRLANAKLAMHSLVAQREHLEKKFGTWVDVEKNYIREPVAKGYETDAVVRPLPAHEEKNVREWLTRNRTWQAYTWSELQAFKFMETKRDVLFRRVDHLLIAIAEYQKKNGISLFDQERWILYDFKYPFVNLKIKYRPSYQQYTAPTPTIQLPN